MSLFSVSIVVSVVVSTATQGEAYNRETESV